MPFPTTAEMLDPLLVLLSAHPSGIRPRDVYVPFGSQFPQMVPSDLDRQMHDGRNEWQNRVQWAREALAKDGLLDRSQHGVWKLTPEGFELAARLTRRMNEDQTPPIVEPQSEASSNEAAQKMLIALVHEMSNAELPWNMDRLDDGSVTLSYDGRLRVILRP